MNCKRILPLLLFLLTAPMAAQRVAPPTMGWSSWNSFRVNISDTLICRQADALVKNGLDKVGYRYINIDDGFFGGRAADGGLLIHPGRFPNGLKPVADYIHSLGLRAGIYSDAGRNTCGHFWDKDTIAHGVGLYGHDDQDAHFFFRTCGFDFIKIDFCGGDGPQNVEHLDLDEFERYSAIRRAIDGVGRRDVRINVCRWAMPGTWVSDIGSSWRIAADINPSWRAVRRIISENRYLSAYATGGAYNDMDMLEIGRGLSPEEERSHFALWCIQSSPLLIGCDLTRIPEPSLRLISNPEAIAVNQDRLGRQAYIVSQHDVWVYVKDIEREGGKKRAVALFNPTDRDITATLALRDIDLDGRTAVRDLLAQADLDDITGDTLRIKVRAHDTQLLRLHAQRRLERTVYEAETAWLQRYQELGMNNELGYAQPADDAKRSGGALVTHLGMHADNYLEWREVRVKRNGTYRLTLHYRSPEDRVLSLSVNGEASRRVAPPRNNAGDVTVIVKLNKGKNTIRIANAESWCADIDKMTLEPESVRRNPAFSHRGHNFVSAGISAGAHF